MTGGLLHVHELHPLHLATGATIPQGMGAGKAAATSKIDHQPQPHAGCEQRHILLPSHNSVTLQTSTFCGCGTVMAPTSTQHCALLLLTTM